MHGHVQSSDVTNLSNWVLLVPWWPVITQARHHPNVLRGGYLNGHISKSRLLAKLALETSGHNPLEIFVNYNGDNGLFIRTYLLQFVPMRFASSHLEHVNQINKDKVKTEQHKH